RAGRNGARAVGARAIGCGRLSGGSCVRIPCRDSVVYPYFMPAYRLSVLGVIVLAACAHPRVGTGVPTGGGETHAVVNDRCVLSTGAAPSRAPVIKIGLTDPIDPRHAPIPTNDGERLVFRHLYETPLSFDCDGKATPELAEKWVKDDGGRRWTFRL